MSTLTVERQILIHAPARKVWDVLTKPSYIQQWDEIPEDYDKTQDLRLGTIFRWEAPSGRFTEVTATIVKPSEKLQLSLFVSSWELDPAPNNIGYTYTLHQDGDHTHLTLTVGDFSSLPNGKDYYDASTDFADTALPKIKALSEETILTQQSEEA